MYIVSDFGKHIVNNYLKRLEFFFIISLNTNDILF